MASPNQLAAALGLGSMFSSYYFDIKQSKDGQFFWLLHNDKGNTEPFAQSETYTTKQSCIRSIELVKAQAAAANIRDTTSSGLLGG
jgi:uncharacterized protein YegP (UPF0339 family)